MALPVLRPLLHLAGATALALLLLDALLVRSGLYARVIEPSSTAGSIVNATLAIARSQVPARHNVLVLGNSQMAEGFSAPRADADAGRSDLHFVNGAVPGTDLRIWNYLLRAVDPNADRFDTVALMVDGNLDDNASDLGNYALDTRYVLPLLRLGDTFDYPDTFKAAAERAAARRAILLPLQALHEDVLALLAAPRARYAAITEGRQGWLVSVDNYPGREARLPDLPLDANGTPRDWGTLTAPERAELERYFGALRQSAPPELRAANSAYYRLWLGRIAARYAAHGGRVLMFVAPRGPWHQRLAPAPSYVGAEADLIASGALQALPADAFVALENPQFFFDTLHMNRDGRERFTREFAQAVAAQRR